MLRGVELACGSHEAAAFYSLPAVIMPGHLLQAFMMQLRQQPAAQRTRFKSLPGLNQKHSYAMWARGDRRMLHEQQPTTTTATGATLAHGQG
ncbi:hypothetical protein M5D96_012172 [Drosophila gunungcola]|uniref:Uncharacterized protein n=1 Tax=Drosophila gunungcola TaxID=103775 RepID=A0A9P9YDL3_9MUSC|nr:hypothetical protein M5D96_012172 [Drosophila gunungcola]